MTSSGDRFYDQLPPIGQFIQVTNPHQFVPLPQDWYVVVTDVVQSTIAIGQGQYREVNFLGAATITSVLNTLGDLVVPFVFGGDGASLAIPGRGVAPARRALLALQELARDRFQLDLRIGIIPVADITQRYPLLVAKIQVAPYYDQAVFWGGGLTYATELLKRPGADNPYLVRPNPLDPPTANALPPDLTGLECRWQAIASPHGAMATLIVAAYPGPQAPDHYRAVIQFIEALYGDPPNPIVPDQLRLSLQAKHLAQDVRGFAPRRSRWSYGLTLFKIRLINWLGMVFMHLGVRLQGVDWGQYRQQVSLHSDYRKFDDVLRMVLSGTPAQHEALRQFLEQRYQQSHLAYGLHLSSTALMTCLVFERQGRQVHFVDGGDGGYVIAARQLKHRLQTKAIPLLP